MDFLTILSYGFMRRALIAGCLVSVSCAILGIFLVLRRESMIGHGLAHVTFGGVALALMLNMAPLPVTLFTALLAGWWITHLKEKARLGGDTGIGIVSSLGMAAGVLLASLAGDFNADLLSYLFGTILAIGPEEVWIAGGLAIAVIACLCLFYNELIYTTFDTETAFTAGIPVKRLDLLIIGLTAVTVVIGMKVVGLLLVASLMIIPAATGLILANTFKSAVLKAVGFALFSILAGLTLSFYADFPPSGAIVLLNGFFLGIALLIK